MQGDSRRFHWLLAACAVCGLAQPSRAAEPQKGPVPNAEAMATLDACLKKLGALASYEMRFRQETLLPQLSAVSEGKLALAPGRKVRYELAVRRGATQGAVKIVCDGGTIWKSVSFGGTPEFETYALAELEAETQKLARAETNLDIAKAQDLQKNLELEHGFRGILPALEDLKARLVFTKREAVELKTEAGTRPAILLEGEWGKDSKNLLIPPRQEPARGPDGKPIPGAPTPADPAELYEKRQDMLFVPRKARLWIDTETQFPLRLTWLGPRKYEGPDEPLIQLDWLGLTPQPADKLSPQFSLSAEERKAPSRPLDFKAAMKQRVDRMIQLQEQEKRLLNSRPLDAAPGAGKP